MNARQQQRFAEHVFSGSNELGQKSEIENGDLWVQQVGKQSLNEAEPDSATLFGSECGRWSDWIRLPRTPESATTDVNQISCADELYPFVETGRLAQHNREPQSRSRRMTQASKADAKGSEERRRASAANCILCDQTGIGPGHDRQQGSNAEEGYEAGIHRVSRSIPDTGWSESRRTTESPKAEAVA